MTQTARFTAAAWLAAGLAAPAFAAEPGVPFYADSSFWALVALIIFLVFVWAVGGFRFIANALDKRSTAIAAELEEAKALRSEASERLIAAEKAARSAETDAEEILAAAKTEADAIREKARQNLSETIARRKAQAEARIARAEADALSDVRRAAADAAHDAARRVLTQQGHDPFEAAADEIEAALGERAN